jgi:3'-phosphoadenosine 5'-phosphosulfate (PAPS) 3'-phosphatase
MQELLRRHPAPDHVLLGGVGYKVHAILAGEADTYFASPGTLHAWDLAAPLLVATEAGIAARATDGSALVVPSHRDGLAQGVLFTRPDLLEANLGFFAGPGIGELLARRDPR